MCLLQGSFNTFHYFQSFSFIMFHLVSKILKASASQKLTVIRDDQKAFLVTFGLWNQHDLQPLVQVAADEGQQVEKCSTCVTTHYRDLAAVSRKKLFPTTASVSMTGPTSLAFWCLLLRHLHTGGLTTIFKGSHRAWTAGWGGIMGEMIENGHHFKLHFWSWLLASKSQTHTHIYIYIYIIDNLRIHSPNEWDYSHLTTALDFSRRSAWMA